MGEVKSYVIPLKTVNVFKKGEKYAIINKDNNEYEVAYSPLGSVWISKYDTEAFKFHVVD